MDNEKVIYSLCIEDILAVIEENDIKIELTEQNINYIKDRIGDTIDWRGAIEFALSDIK
ncbi:MAG: hypothetical protein ABH873_06075 [Candidatus Firestonebacteria bacterium]